MRYHFIQINFFECFSIDIPYHELNTKKNLKIISKHIYKGIEGRISRSRLTGFNSRYYKPVVDIWIRCIHRI